MPRLLLLLCTLTLAGCATLAAAETADNHSEEACFTDTQCLSGRCEYGKCTRFPQRDHAIGGTECSYAGQCPGGSCQFGRCTPAPPSSGPARGSSCIFGNDCRDGTCTGLDCR
jgi:hypothetical protein